MRFISSFIVSAIIISIACAAPSINKIDAAVNQLECVSDAILQYDQKYAIGNLWPTVYFPIVMQTNSIYGCGVHERSDECVDGEIRSAVDTLDNFLYMLRENNTIAAEEIQESIGVECGIQLHQLVELDESDESDEFDLGRNKALNIKSKHHVNIEHIKCIVTAITIAVGDNQDALDWIRYQYELTQSIAKLILCQRFIVPEQIVCMAFELRTTIKTLINYWKFLNEKRHLEVLKQIRAEIKDKCYSKLF